MYYFKLFIIVHIKKKMSAVLARIIHTQLITKHLTVRVPLAKLF